MEKKLVNQGTAGFEEKLDVLVFAEPIATGIEVVLTSSVKRQYGEHIIALIKTVVQEAGYDNVKITAVDGGAWDYTIKARVLGALQRGMNA